MLATSIEVASMLSLPASTTSVKAWNVVCPSDLVRPERQHVTDSP
jgi:hypothetical protein